MESCNNCEILLNVINVAPKNAHINYAPTIELIKELVKQKRLYLYHGDCELNEIYDVLNSELHYTVCHYLKCSKCNKTYFVGACIRGTPAFNSYDKISDTEIRKLIWGSSGNLNKV